MEILEAILTRRSIRKFKDTPVPTELVEKILQAGMIAPSAGNQQPWQFIVIQDRQIMEQIPKICPYAEMIKQSPVAILVCGDLSLERLKGYWVQDVSAATENILLAAHGLGLGAVWTGVYPVQERVSGLRAMFKAPEHIVPFALIPIGYPNQQLDPANRFNRTRIHYDRWKSWEVE